MEAGGGSDADPKKISIDRYRKFLRITLQQRTLLFLFLLTLRVYRAAPQLRQLDRVQTDREDESRESRKASTNSNHRCAPLTASQ